jgi:hypothetical protein
MKDPISDTNHPDQSIRHISLSGEKRLSLALTSISHRQLHLFRHLSAERLLSRTKPSCEIFPAIDSSKDLVSQPESNRKENLWSRGLNSE